MESKSRGVLDAPQEPVIGLAEGETRWRGITALFEACIVVGTAQARLCPSYRLAVRKLN
jgi:hypothetical protein